MSATRPEATPSSVTHAGTEEGAVEAKVRKFPCEACGAGVVWNPGARALKCPYCGAEKKLPATAEAVLERPIEEALSAPHDLGWGAERKTIKCGRCGAVQTLDPGIAAAACAFCGSATVVEAPPSGDMIRPQGLLPFQVDRSGATQKFRSWVSSLWFRPNDLKTKASVTGLSGAYVPFWTFDAATHSAWTAEAGFYYQVPVQVIENGNTVTRMETRTRWELASGFLEHFFDDLPVPASRGIERGLAAAIEPYPTGGLVPYEPSYLSGFLAEEYAIGAQEALTIAQRRMESELAALCGAQVPGDTYRNLSVRTSYSGVAFKNALLPIWIAAYQYGGKPYRFLVNGVTGRVDGHAPLSWVKVTLAILAALTAILFFLSTQH